MGVAAAETMIAWQAHEGPRLTQAQGYDIIHCTVCGFRHVVPLPEPGNAASQYRTDYYGNEKPTFIARAADDQAWAELAQIDRLELMERLLGPQRRRLLDVGAGPGYFLKTAEARGWRALGVEPSRQAAAHARSLGLEVVEGFFDAETAGGLGHFDAVHLNNVLEHVANPISILAMADVLLERGGVLCVGVPNDFSPLQIAAHAAGSREWWLAPPHHLNYFDFDSLAQLVGRFGFRVAQRMTSFPMEAFLLMGDDYTDDPSIGRVCHERRKRLDLALEAAGLRETRRSFYAALAQAGLGREAVIVAVKP